MLYAAFAVFSFKELIVLNVWLYSLALLVELAAFLAARRARRRWRGRGACPAGSARALVVAGVPAALSLLAMATAGWLNTLAGVAAALTGPVAYALAARGSSRFSSMTRARQSSAGSEYDVGLPADRDVIAPLARAASG